MLPNNWILSGKSAREELIKAETTLLANHRRMMLLQIRNQNEEMQSFIKSGKGVYLPPKYSGGGQASRISPRYIHSGACCK